LYFLPLPHQQGEFRGMFRADLGGVLKIALPILSNKPMRIPLLVF
jgi:hypothetical protein